MTEREINIQFHKSLAESYDQIVAKDRLGLHLRRVTQGTMLRYFKSGQKVLELNCGTGTDALVLAQHGINVVATDLSPAMIAITSQKISAAGMNSAVSVQVRAIEDIHLHESSAYDGIISNFNGINYVQDISFLPAELHRILRPNGIAILTSLNPLCMSEILYFTARLRWKSVRRRLTARGSELGRALHPELALTLHWPFTFRQKFSPYFLVKEMRGFGIFTPPHGLSASYHPDGNFDRRLEALEESVARNIFFCTLSDQYYIVLQRKEDNK